MDIYIWINEMKSPYLLLRSAYVHGICTMAILKFKMAVWTKLANAYIIVLIEFLDP